MTPTVVRTDDLARYTWDSLKVTITVDRVHERNRDLWAEVTIQDHTLPRGPLIRRRLNLQADRTIRGVAKELEERIGDTPWPLMLEYVVSDVIDHHRGGAAPIPLDDDHDAEPPGYLLDPLIASSGVTVLFAPGGTGKSMVALAAALSVTTGMDLLDTTASETVPSIYLDWESEHRDHKWRLQAIARAHGIPRPIKDVYYRREHASLPSVSDGIRRHIVDKGIGFAVIDSLGGARGGAPESAEETLRLMTSIRSWQIPVLAIDHESKAQIQSQAARAMPFGSVYTWNSARLVWRLIPSSDSDTSGTVMMLLCSKSNNDRLPPRRALRIHVSRQDGTISITPTAPELVPDLADRLPVKDRIKLAILDANGRPQSAKDLIELTGLSAGSVRSALHRYTDTFTKVGDHWALVEDRQLPDPW